MSIKLRDLIRSVRACKTAAEERAVIAKECALIRTAIKEEQEQYRHRNVAKLLYIHMLGYPTHFGQMECVKLIAAPGFPEKRIGYLAVTMLLNEETDILTLVTNSMKNDLNNSQNPFIVGLALTTLGNLCTADMARDLAPEVEKLIRGNNSYLRKKSALALIRMLHKEPDLLEHMAEKVVGLLKDRSHGVLNSALQLIIEILIMDPSQAQTYSRLVPSLVRLLKNLISMGYSPEHDVAGITDPFLQVRLLRLLGLLGKGNDEASEAMNDVLAQVATSTESAKNAGNAVLYECVKTILTIQSDASLRGLAVNILGRFLLNRDNSIRYVALHMLAEVVHQDAAAVQRHRTTIVECLKDADISIRVRAMELIFQLVNEQNASILTPELLNYLTTAPAEQKGLLASRIMAVTEKFSPTKQWRIDTLIQLLTLAGNYCDERVPRLTIVFITQSEGLHAYAVHKLYRAFLKDTSQIGLVNVAIWCIGEYGELLLRPCPDGSDGTFDAVSESDVVAALERVTRLHNADATTKGLLINGLMKLTTRFSAASQAPIQNIIAAHRSSMILELQQRAVEYCSILATQPEQLRRETLGKMPVLDEATMRRKHAEFAALTDESPSSSQRTPSSAGIGGIGALPALQTSAAGGLLDLEDIFGGAPAQPTPGAAAAPISPVAALGTNGDLLGDAPVVSPTPATSTSSAAIDLLDIFSTPATPSTPALTPLSGAPVLSPVADFGAFAAAPVQQAEPSFTAFEKAGFQVVFKCSKPEPGNLSTTNVDVVFRNTSAREVNQLLFQAAVPKYLKLDLRPATGTVVPAHGAGTVEQSFRLSNSMQGQKPLVVRIKLHYVHGGETHEEVVQVSGFPATY